MQRQVLAGRQCSPDASRKTEKKVGTVAGAPYMYIYIYIIHSWTGGSEGPGPDGADLPRLQRERVVHEMHQEVLPWVIQGLHKVQGLGIRV